jgi:hypothetical protein
MQSWMKRGSRNKKRVWSQHCLQCIKLQAALVKHKVEFAGYEAGVSELCVLAQFEYHAMVTGRRHCRGQGHTVVDNYRLDRTPVVRVWGRCLARR